MYDISSLSRTPPRESALERGFCKSNLHGPETVDKLQTRYQ